MKKTRCLVSRIIFQRNNSQMRIIYCSVKMVLDAEDLNPIRRYDLHSSTSSNVDATVLACIAFRALI